MRNKAAENLPCISMKRNRGEGEKNKQRQGRETTNNKGKRGGYIGEIRV